jgi:pimeloyl-ACP methyl ester carboxylesterase
MQAWLPRAKAVTLPALGHSLPEEDPQAVAAVLLDFLK